MKISIKNLEDFKRVYSEARPIVKQTLKAAFPELYQKMQEGYKKATQITNQLRETQAIPNQSPVEPIKSKANIIKSIGSKAKNIGKGAVGVVGKYVAPIQGVSNWVSKDSDVVDKILGTGMIGAGGAALLGYGTPYTAPIAAGLVAADTAKKTIVPAIGNKIGKMIYGTGDEYTIDNSGLANPYEDSTGLLNTNLTPEQQAKVIKYNKAILNNQIDKANKVLEEGTNEVNTPFGSGAEQVNQMYNDMYGGNYSVPTPPTRGLDFSPQNSQNGQEGGLNLIQDNLYQTPNQPSLNSIVQPVNYSNEYLASQNNLINQLYQNANQGVRNNMAEFNPYELRPYAQIDNAQMAPVPTQQQGIDYGALLNNFNKAMDADRRQNQVNAFINSVGMFGNPSQKAPVYYVGANGRLNAIELDQPNKVQPLPTDTANNYNKLMGQLQIQQAQQQAALAAQKQAAADLKARQEYIDRANAANALGMTTGYDPQIFMSTDYGKAIIEQMIHPEAQASANIREAQGKAPTEAMLKAAEQRGTTAGKLDEIEMQKQYDVMIANINRDAQIWEAKYKEAGLDKRQAAQLAAQQALSEYSQMMDMFKTNAQLNNQIRLQEMKNQNAENVARIYRSPQQQSEEEQIAKDWNTAMSIGLPIPQAIKYMQVRYPNFGLNPAEINELNK